MSAYVVDRNHIRYLIGAAIALGRRGGDFSWWSEKERKRLSLGEGNATEIGQMLWNENLYSVGHRYNGLDGPTSDLPGAIGEGYEYEHHPVHTHAFDPVQVLHSCSCYEYQSCEHDGWESSEAFAFVQALIHKAIRALPGYDDKIWGAPELPDDSNLRIVSQM